MLSSREIDTTTNTLIKRPPDTESSLGYWVGLKAGERESAFYKHIAPHMNNNSSILQAIKVENNPFAIHLPYVANAECLGRGRGKGEPMDVVMKVARRLGSTHMDLLNAYSRTEVRNSCGELLRDDIWTIAREKFPNGVKYVREHIWKEAPTSLMTYEDARAIMLDTHGVEYALHHGDVWGNNILLKEDGGVVFIDWQLCSEGDPLLDLGMLVGLTLVSEDMTVENVYNIITEYTKGVSEDENGRVLEESIWGSAVLGCEDAGGGLGFLLSRIQKCFYAWCCVSLSFASLEEYYPDGDDADILKNRFSVFLNLKK